MRLSVIFKKLLLSLAAVLLVSFWSAMPAFAQSEPTTQQVINNGLCSGSNLQVPPGPPQCVTKGGGTQSATQTLNKFVHTVVNLFSAIVAIVAVIMIIVGGFRYVTSGGSDTSVTSAKNTILYAIIGLIIVALSQILVRFTLNKINNG